MMLSLSTCVVGLTIRPPKHPKNKVAFAPTSVTMRFCSRLAGARSQHIHRWGASV